MVEFVNVKARPRVAIDRFTGINDAGFIMVLLHREKKCSSHHAAPEEENSTQRRPYKND